MSFSPNQTPWPHPVTFGTIRFFLIVGFVLGFLIGADLVFLAWMLT